MSASVPTPEEVAREYQAKLQAAARAHYSNDALMAEWMDYATPAMAEATLISVRTYTRHLLEWLSKRRLHMLAVTRKDALGYVRLIEAGDYSGYRPERGAVKAGTVLNHLKYADLLFRYLREVRGLIPVSPFMGLVKTYAKDHRAGLRPDLRALDEEETALHLAGAESLDDFTLGLFLFKTGIRRDECAKIKESQIDWTTRTIQLDAHRKRTHLRAYFDEELEHFLKLKVERNHKLHPGNPYLWPSPRSKGRPVTPQALNEAITRMAKNGPLARTVTDWNDGAQKVTAHTSRRSFTSVLRRNGCPDHIVAVLRGDSLRSRSELVREPTMGIYTKMGKKQGIPELRYWYDKTMPQVGALDVWERIMPRGAGAGSLAALIRSAEAGAS